MGQGSVVLPLTLLAGGAALVYVGITNPAGGGFAGLGNLIRGVPNTKATTDPTGFAATAADLAAVGGGATGLGLGGGTGGGVIAPSVGPVTGKRAKVVAAAQSWLGVPYVWGGNTRSGVDCSGLTLQVFATVGVHLPRVSAMQALRGTKVSAAQAQPGDLVAFGRPVHHVGILVAPGQIIHAPHPGTVVRVEAVWNTEPVQYRNLLDHTRTKPAKPHKRHHRKVTQA